MSFSIAEHAAGGLVAFHVEAAGEGSKEQQPQCSERAGRRAVPVRSLELYHWRRSRWVAVVEEGVDLRKVKCPAGLKVPYAQSCGGSPGLTQHTAKAAAQAKKQGATGLIIRCEQAGSGKGHFSSIPANSLFD